MEVSAGPFVGIIAQVIMWTGLIIVLAMFKGFVTHAFSMALSEFLFRTQDSEVRQKMTRWLANGDVVLGYLEEMDEKRGAK